jgi:type IV pilus assembly protein PilF
MKQAFSLGCAVLLSACAYQLPKSSKHKLAETYAEKGAAYLAEGKPEIAAQDLKKSLALDPNNPTAHATLALLYEQLGMWDQANSHFKRAKELAPSDPAILGNYGRFLCHRGQHREGLQLLERASSDKLYPKRWISLTNAGECALESGQLETAEQYLREALKLNPENEVALTSMIKLMVAKQEYLKARAFLQRLEALVENPKPEVLELGFKIESALGDQQAAESYKLRKNGH